MIQQNIFLIGMMGVGKTTIGRHLAGLLGHEFVDSDVEVERRAGADISWIFDMEGEEGFRKREHQVLRELTARTGVVLATGGGAVLGESNRDILRARGVVVYLSASINKIVERTRRDKKRPLLQSGDLRERIATLLGEREPLYQETAHIVVNIKGRPSRAVAREIARDLSAQPPAHTGVSSNGRPPKAVAGEGPQALSAAPPGVAGAFARRPAARSA